MPLAKAPETIAVEGARMAIGLVREFGIGAVITEVNLHLLTPAGSRTYSRWEDQWHTTGVLA